MASVKKQEHLEAGKRKLEEFRKKKAADRAKKAVSTTQLHPAHVDQHDKQQLDDQRVRVTDLNGAATSNGIREDAFEISQVTINNEDQVTEFILENDKGSYNTHANPSLNTNYYNSVSADSEQAPAKDLEHDRHNTLHSAGSINVSYGQPEDKSYISGISNGALGRYLYGVATDQATAFHPQMVSGINDNSGQPNPYVLEEASSKDSSHHAKDFAVTSPAADIANFSSQNSGSPQMQNKFGYTSLQNSGVSFLYSGERKLSNSLGHSPSGDGTSFWRSGSQSTAFGFDAQNSSNRVPFDPAVVDTKPRRSRPSFLDSINVERVPFSEPEQPELFGSKVHGMDFVRSSASDKSSFEAERIQPSSKITLSDIPSSFEHSVNSSVVGNGPDVDRRTVHESSMEMKIGSYSRKLDEDFAALEQHIEDLTQEKFSLQRALEASRALAESLASENSSLTDSYNQQGDVSSSMPQLFYEGNEKQGSVVNQLKSDMEKLQEEIKGQLAEMESVKMEYANAQLECNAADERAKLLASEVIGLEEKALRLRSNELKLERQLENLQAEITSYKKKITSLEKDRQDLQLTIDSLQEEKKLLQTKLRKTSGNGKFTDVKNNPSNRKDVSTSTEDLIAEDDTDAATDSSNQEMHTTAHILGSDASSSLLFPENSLFNSELSSSYIPPDQSRTIQNINTLITELTLEKQELMQALLAESSESSKLKEMNKELSQKLEVQTQRLELLTAQSMANENIPSRPPDFRSVQDNTSYADEGDEVVERVLGWIMKLFPGGPSRRRTSKLI